MRYFGKEKCDKTATTPSEVPKNRLEENKSLIENYLVSRVWQSSRNFISCLISVCYILLWLFVECANKKERAYNTRLDIIFIKHLSAIVKTSNQSKAPSDIPINDLGFDNEEHEKDDTQPKSDSQTQKSEDNKKKKKERERRRTLISNLRAISIRIPLLVYGADIPFEQDINIDNLTDIVDDVSWEEFMPKGLTKEDFKRCKKFYDETIFVGAGRAIRNRIKDAEKLPVMKRVKGIAEIFGTFRNPDKETVLTPWRVVNMHLGNCLGGFNFFDKDFKHTLETPRCIDHGKISEETVWNTAAKIFEVNSKTGLYPLYMAYSIFTARRQKKPEVSDNSTGRIP